MINLSTSTEYPSVVFLPSPNMAIVDNTLQVSESPVRLMWISWLRLVETKLVVRINISRQVVGSLVVEHVLVTGCSPKSDWTLVAEFLINVLLTTISTDTATPLSYTGGWAPGDNTTPALLLSISLHISYINTTIIHHYATIQLTGHTYCFTITGLQVLH